MDECEMYKLYKWNWILMILIQTDMQYIHKIGNICNICTGINKYTVKNIYLGLYDKFIVFHC